MRVAMMGTRGVPARYGGFETAIEEIGRRLVARGHEVTVYCRQPPGEPTVPAEYLGMSLLTLPALRSKSLETLSHSALSAVRSAFGARQDVIFLFNSANAIFLPLVRARAATAVHVDGLEWQRSKWSGAGRRFYRLSESLAVRWADALIADAEGISDYYRTEFSATTDLIAYGAPILAKSDSDRVEDLDLTADGYHLVVARFEPENHVEVLVRGYRSSSARLPLVVVGAAPYNDEYTRRVHDAADGDPRVRFLGSVWDQRQLDQLYSNARLYLHGHSVGGTNPSLLRAMGAAAPVAAFDVVFNREVLGSGSKVFRTEADVASQVLAAEADSVGFRAYGETLQTRAACSYRWDDVADSYEQLAERLANGESRRGEVSGRRRQSTISTDLGAS